MITEPGGALVAVPIEFHASVVDVKDIDQQTLVLTNASRTNIDPLFRKDGSYDFRIDAQSTESAAEQVLTGFTLVEGDRLMTLKDQPALQVDDRIVFHKVGAYTLCLQPMFIEYLPAVYTRREGELRLVRKKWGAAEYVQGSQWAEASGPVETDARLHRPVNGPRQSLAKPVA